LGKLKVKNSKKFPCFKRHSPLIFVQNPKIPYSLNYLENRVFRAASRTENVDGYISSLNKVEKRRESFGKKLGFLI